jgi:hypothetical protein
VVPCTVGTGRPSGPRRSGACRRHSLLGLTAAAPPIPDRLGGAAPLVRHDPGSGAPPDPDRTGPQAQAPRSDMTTGAEPDGGRGAGAWQLAGASRLEPNCFGRTGADACALLR